MIQGVTFKKDISWEEVFAVWKAHEGEDPVWQQFAVQEKGWESWELWRRTHSEKINAKEKQWKLYEIENANDTIPQFRMGPFQGWQKHYEDKLVHTFADLDRDHAEWVAGNVGVKDRLANFPQGTQFIGMHLEDDDAVMLYEGHHRAAAVARAAHSDYQSIKFYTNPVIAMTTISKEEMPLLQEMLDSGTGRPTG